MNTRSSNKTAAFSNSEYFDMILCLGKAECDCKKARELYRQRFIDGKQKSKCRRLPSVECFDKLQHSLKETGKVPSAFEDDDKDDDEFEDDDLENVDEEDLAYYDDIHARHVHTCKPIVQLENHESRLNFCTWYLEQVKASPDFASKVLWTDEATLTYEGIRNVHSSTMWEHMHPDAAAEASKRKWRITVWAGIIGQTLIGPIFLPENVTGKDYLSFLKNELENELKKLPTNHITFQHIGTPAYFTKKVQKYLNTRFNQWIGKGGHIAMPVVSPDLNPVEYYLWTHVKYEVYGDPEKLCRTREEMEARITEAFKSAKIIKNMPSSMLERAQLCVEQKGSGFEFLLF